MIATMIHGPGGDELVRHIRGAVVSPAELSQMHDLMKRTPFAAPVLRVLFDAVFPATQDGLLSVFDITPATGTGTLGEDFEERMRVVVAPLLLSVTTDLISSAFSVLRYDEETKQLYVVDARQVDTTIYDRLGQRYWKVTDVEPPVGNIDPYILALMRRAAPPRMGTRNDMVVLVHPNQRMQPDYDGHLSTDFRCVLGYSALNTHNMRAYMIGIAGAAGPTVIASRKEVAQLGHGLNHDSTSSPYSQESSGVTPAINRATNGQSRALARSAEAGTVQANLASRVATDMTVASAAAKAEGAALEPHTLFPTVIPQYVASSTSRLIHLPQGSDMAGSVAAQPPPGGVNDIHDLVQRTIAAACGVPSAFVLPSTGPERIDAAAIDQLIAAATTTRQLAATALQSILQILFSTELVELLRRNPDVDKSEVVDSLIEKPLFTVVARPVELPAGLQAVLAACTPPEPASATGKKK